MTASTVGFKVPEADLHRKSPRIFAICVFISILCMGITVHIPIFNESSTRTIVKTPVIIQLENIPETRHTVRAPAPRLAVPLEIDDEFMPDDVTIESTALDLNAVSTPAPPPAVFVPDTGAETEEEEIFEYFSVEEQPERKNTIIPIYPEMAKRTGIEGTVFLKVLVNAKGLVDSVEVIKGPAVFHQSSLDAAKSTEFTPAKHNDRAVSCWVIMPFRFLLEN